MRLCGYCPTEGEITTSLSAAIMAARTGEIARCLQVLGLESGASEGRSMENGLITRIAFSNLNSLFYRYVMVDFCHDV